MGALARAWARDRRLGREGFLGGCLLRRRRPRGPVLLSYVAGGSGAGSRLGELVCGSEESGTLRADAGVLGIVGAGGLGLAWTGLVGIAGAGGLGLVWVGLLGIIGTGEAGLGTLRAGAGGLGGTGTGSSGEGTSVARPVSKVVRSLRTATWLSAMGARGEPTEGLAIALVMSVSPARMRSLDEAMGMVTFVGNQEIVSQMRSARVSQIQIL